MRSECSRARSGRLQQLVRRQWLLRLDVRAQFHSSANAPVASLCEVSAETTINAGWAFGSDQVGECCDLLCSRFVNNRAAAKRAT